MRKGITRRELIARAGVVVGGALLAKGRAAQAEEGVSTRGSSDDAAAFTDGSYTPVVSPNGSTLPWRMIDGVKVFHLIAEPVKREFAPGLVVDCWGYNGETPGPLIEVVEGDRVRFYVTNRLTEPTSVHWHGILLPNGMDGVSGLNQSPIRPNETFRYEFTVTRPGTYMYHSHFDEMVQMGMGMMGMFVVHPKHHQGPPVDRDFAIMLSEWFIKPGTSKPDTAVMTDFNVLTMNSKAFPGTAPLVVKLGQRVRIRLGNLGAMDHHPVHLHGYYFRVTATDGGRIPEAGQWPETTVLVPVGSTRDIEFVADAEGDWAFHCHMTHHVMNQMGHDIPNLIGIDVRGLDEKVSRLLPDYMTMGESGMGGHAHHMEHMAMPNNSIPMRGTHGKHGYIDMGGMFTVLKVREGITDYSDPGWYESPPGTLAQAASLEELTRDGIGN